MRHSWTAASAAASAYMSIFRCAAGELRCSSGQHGAGLSQETSASKGKEPQLQAAVTMSQVLTSEPCSSTTGAAAAANTQPSQAQGTPAADSGDQSGALQATPLKGMQLDAPVRFFHKLFCSTLRRSSTYPFSMMWSGGSM